MQKDSESSSLSHSSSEQIDKSIYKDMIKLALAEADESFSHLEALCAFSSVGGFEVPSQAYLALRVARGLVKIAKTEKYKFSDAVIDGIGLAVPSIRLAGIKQLPAANKLAKITQIGIKRFTKKGSITNNFTNTAGVYSAAVPLITNNKSFKAAEIGLFARRAAALKPIGALLAKLTNKMHNLSRSKVPNLNRTNELSIAKLTRGKKESANEFEKRLKQHKQIKNKNE